MSHETYIGLLELIFLCGVATIVVVTIDGIKWLLFGRKKRKYTITTHCDHVNWTTQCSDCPHRAPSQEARR